MALRLSGLLQKPDKRHPVFTLMPVLFAVGFGKSLPGTISAAPIQIALSARLNREMPVADVKIDHIDNKAVPGGRTGYPARRR